jgi:hypothetical protein
VTPYPWRCPKCGAGFEKCGKKSKAKKGHQIIPSLKSCDGLCCRHPYTDNHTNTSGIETVPCRRAHCYHCGWTGAMPAKKGK